MIQRLMVASLLVLQGLLAAYELVARYDTGVRQVALTVTNLSTVLIFLLVYRYLRRSYGITLPWIVFLIVCASVWLDALGNFQHFYGTYWWWDRLTHTTGGLAVTAGIMAVCTSLWTAGRFRVSWRSVNLYAFSLAQTLGAIYEISEWLGDVMFGTRRVGGPFDSPRDLFFNMLGGALVFLAAAWWRARHRAIQDDPQ